MRAHAHIADPYASYTISVLIEAVRSRREPSDGVAFIPVHGGDVKDGDTSEGNNMGLFL